jgi:hypothetical protein
MSVHNHLCRDCGKVLYSCEWCREENDHRISGRCTECWEKLGEFLAIEHAEGYGVDLVHAKYDSIRKYNPDYAPYALVRIGTESPIRLQHMRLRDMPDRRSDGSFAGCSNQVWIISQEEWDGYLSLNSERRAEKEETERKEREQVEARRTEKEARRRTGRIYQVYDEVQPKGGEDGVDGYFDAAICIEDVISRVVIRDVFDFGCYGYPKRVEGTQDVFNQNVWTQPELMAVNWGLEFGPFKCGIRM